MTLLELLNQNDRYSATNGMQLTFVDDTSAQARIVVVENQSGELIASATALAYRKETPMLFENLM